MYSLLLLALSLSLDATAASVCWGLQARAPALKEGLWAGLWFGGFQGLMTGLGGLFGGLLSRELWQVGKLLSFGLLAFLGARMVWQALCPLRREGCPQGSFSPGSTALLALATSLDALAAGLSLTYWGQGLLCSTLVIGLVTFCLSLLGVLLGRRVGQGWSRPAGAAGGLVLLGLGLKILLG